MAFQMEDDKISNRNKFYNNSVVLRDTSATNADSLDSKQNWIRNTSEVLETKFHQNSIEGRYFVERVTEAIGQTKKKVILLLNSSLASVTTAVTVGKVNLALKQLDGHWEIVLRFGVPKIYQVILGLLTKTDNNQQRRLFQNLKATLQQLAKLSIVFKQYQKRKREVHSQKTLSNAASPIDQEAIKRIQVEIMKQKFYDLAIDYLDNQRLRLTGIKEICRICEIKINLGDMTRHLRICQKKYLEIQQLRTNTSKLVKLQIQLKRLCESDSIEDNLSQQQKEAYRYIIQEVDCICCSEGGSNLVVSEYIDPQIQLQNHLVMSFNMLVRSRTKTLFSLELIDDQGSFKQRSDMEGEDDFMLGVDSVIKTPQHMECTQTSLVRQNKEEGIQNSFNSFESLQSRKCKTPNARINWSIDSREVTCKRKTEEELRKFLSTKKTFKDFQVLKFLGKGAFGKVFLVRKVLTNDYYAVKCIKMDNSLLMDETKIQNLKNQHDIFKKISGEFLVKAAFSFSEGGLHMFFLEYMPGGDLGSLLEEEVYLQQDVAKFYLAEIVLAIEHLHNLNIIHRDLKPQNLVFDEKGHLKLTDFGLSKQGITKKLLITKKKASLNFQEEDQIVTKTASKSIGKRKTLISKGNGSSTSKSIVGTPDYIAPQVLNGTSSDNSSIDWWSLGVIVYEVLIGQKPFGAMTIQKVFTNIKTMKIQWPSIGYQQGCITPEAQDLIKSLLNVDFMARLGAQNIDQIKEHLFFQGISWQELKTQKPPLPGKTPTISHLQEDVNLRCQIEQEMVEQVSQKGQKFQLDHYMRVDLLFQKTITQQEKALNQMKQKQTKLNYLYSKYMGAAKSMRNLTNLE